MDGVSRRGKLARTVLWAVFKGDEGIQLGCSFKVKDEGAADRGADNSVSVMRSLCSTVILEPQLDRACVLLHFKGLLRAAPMVQFFVDRLTDPA
jgi:hypothetical protein